MDVLFTSSDFMPTEEKCVSVLRRLRWKDNIKCVYCNSSHVVSNGLYMLACHKLMCRACGKSFNAKTGTIFEDSRVPLREWVYIAKEIRHKSIRQISRELGRRYATVHRIVHLIMSSTFAQRYADKLKGEVEIDEMYMAAGEKGSKTLKRPPRKRGLKLRGRGTYDKDKPPIVGAIERNGKLSLNVMHNMKKRSVNKVLKQVDKKSIVYTDDFKAYLSLKKKGYTHRTVNHSEHEYARGRTHTNTIEGSYQDLRHFLNTFKGVNKSNLHKYISLFEFHKNVKKEPHEALQSMIASCFLHQ